MKAHSAYTLARCAGFGILLAGGALAADDSESIRLATTRTVDWQMQNRSAGTPLREWQQAAMYAGVVAVDDAMGEPLYRDAMRQTGLLNAWRLGTTTYHADFHAVGSMYLSLALREGRPEWAAPTLERLDFILANPSTRGVAEQYALSPANPAVSGNVMRWWWCDALFMAPPVWMQAWLLTGDSRYRDFAVQEWQATDALLYHPTHALYYRDSASKGAALGLDGLPVFWGRGNGWVMGGLVAVLKALPADDPARPWFEGRFQAMAATLAACQKADGFWRMDLLNPSAEPMGESSATAFLCYGLAYGVNAGLLDAATYWPRATNAWAALRGVVQENGRLTQVQPVGSAPGAFNANNTELYGVGGFAFAGAELYRGALRGEYPNSVFAFTNTLAGHTAQDIVYPLADVPVYTGASALPFKVQDDATGCWLAASVIDTDGDGSVDSLHFKDTLLQGQVKQYRMFSGLPAEDTGRFLKDLVAWWRMDGLEDGRAMDEVYTRHAVASGNVSVVAGKIGGAMSLNSGLDSSDALWTSPFPSNLYSCTIAGWVKPSVGYVGKFPRILVCDRFALMLRDESGRSGVLDLACYNTSSAGTSREWAYSNTLSETKITAGVWHHVAVTFDMSNPTVPPRFYLNGVFRPAMLLSGTGTSIISEFGPTVIGNRKNSDRAFAGVIDDLRVYSRELTAQDIRELYRVTAPSAPAVDAGADRVVYGNSACLNGRVDESGLSLSGATPVTRWEAVSYPAGGAPALAAPGSLVTEVGFPMAGSYTFRLTADNGQASASDEVTLDIRDAAPDAGNQPPAVVVAAGARAVTLPLGLRLAAQVADDGIPAGGASRVRWSKTAGPGAVRFEPPCEAETVAWFSEPGAYTLRVEADDGLASASETVEVAVSDGVLPVRWYKMNDVLGSVAPDSARGVHGTALYVSPTQDVARAGLHFNRTNARVEFDFPYLDAYTVSAWVYHTATTAHVYPRILATSGLEINWLGYFQGNQNCVSLNSHQENDVENEWLTPTNSFSREEWGHLALVHDRRGRHNPVMYINGQAQTLIHLKVGNAANPLLPTGARATIGNSPALDRRFNGIIADFRLYDTLLDAGAVSQVMNDALSPDLVCPPWNTPPEVSVAPLPEVVSLLQPLPLTAAVNDDGMRLRQLTFQWRKVSGPGTVLFTYADDPDPDVRFSTSGDYVLEVAVSDGEKTTFANVAVTVRDFSGTMLMLR